MFQNRVQGPCKSLTSIKDEKYVDQPTAAGFTRTVPIELLMNTGESKVQAVKIKSLLCNVNHIILLSEYLIYLFSQKWRSKLLRRLCCMCVHVCVCPAIFCYCKGIHDQWAQWGKVLGTKLWDDVCNQHALLISACVTFIYGKT
jgi:hypothetical protein